MHIEHWCLLAKQQSLSEVKKKFQQNQNIPELLQAF